MSKIGLNKAVKELNRYGDKQVSMIYPAAAIVLWQQFGYRKQKIIARFAESQRAWCYSLLYLHLTRFIFNQIK